MYTLKFNVMKKLIYCSLIILFLFSSCSKDDDNVPEVGTFDDTIMMDMDIGETSRKKYKISLLLKDWFVGNHIVRIETSFKKEKGALIIDIEKLVFSEFKDPMLSRTAETRTTIAPPEKCFDIYPEDGITSIIINRENKTDIYKLDVGKDKITITPVQNTFSKTIYSLYIFPPENSLVFYFAPKELEKKFLDFVNTTVPLELYEYDLNAKLLWILLDRDSNIYCYKNAADYEKIKSLFGEFKEKETEASVHYMENWKKEYMTK